MTFYEKLNNLYYRQNDYTVGVEDASFSDIEKSLLNENEKHFSASRRKEFEYATNYAVGAMKAIPTAPSYEAGDKVKDHLTKKLSTYGFNPDFEYQGSVICNTHIKYNSDIDLLVITNKFYTVEKWDESFVEYKGDVIADMQSLRAACYKILQDVYTVPVIDNTGNKSIKIKKGGILRRDIDVVPANWYDTVKYRHDGEKFNRGVQVFNKATGERTTNFPFLNKKLIDDKDKICNGNYRKLVRLAKNLKVDAVNGSVAKNISSYDIQSLFYHIANSDIKNFSELELVRCGADHLHHLMANTEYFRSLLVPDESRLISERVTFEMLKSLYDEFEELYTKMQGV